MSRALELTGSATWWPSVLWQTTTLELRRDGVRLLVDPGIAPWEVREAAGDGGGHILITHSDWDHVMGIGLLPEDRVWVSPAAAERIDSGEAAASVRELTRPYGVPRGGARAAALGRAAAAAGRGHDRAVDGRLPAVTRAHARMESPPGCRTRDCWWWATTCPSRRSR